MKLETFFEKFDLFAGAPDAVEKMRELVLDFAVQGKLVERRTSEGDGHALLKKLRTLLPERNSKSRSPKDIAVEPETSVEIPSHWALTTVENTTRDTGFFCDGDWVESKDQDPNGDVRLIQLADVGDGKYRDRSSRFMTKEAAKRLNCSYLEAGDILIARMPDPLGRCCRFPGDTKPAVTVVDVCILRSNVTFFDPDFLVVAINCPRFRRLVSVQATGTTRSRISRSNLGVLPIPLPPLAEQKRIVAKMDELMTFCDRLEAQQQERETRHDALSRASLARFAGAPTPANLDLIFHRSYGISPDDVRNSVLALAVQGKLVPQDPNDRRPSVTRGRQFDGLFEVPENWDWIQLADLQPEFQNGASSRGDRDGTPIVVIRLADVESRRIALDNPRAIAIASEQIAKYRLQVGDTLITRVNGSADIVGTFIPVENAIDAIYCDHFIRMRIDPERLFPAYTALVGESQLVRDQIRSLFITTAGQKTVNQSHIRSLCIPLPPLAEQRRIVAIVDELMALVDELETQLATARTTGAILVEAVVARLTAEA